MNMKKIYLIALSSLGSLFVAQAQDVHYSLYGEAPSVINPGLTGVAYDFRANINYKSQWKSFNSAYKTTAANIETAFKHRKLKTAYVAAGFNFYSDVAGDAKFGTTSFNGNFSTIIRVSKNSKLSIGLTGGATTRKIKQDDKLTWSNQYDGFKYQESFDNGEKNFAPGSFTRGDFGGGINWHYSESNLYISSNNGTRADVGASVYHFTTPKNSFYADGNDKINMRYNGYATVVLCKKGSNFSIAPGVIYQRQGKTQELIVSSLFRYILHEQSVHTANEKAFAISAGLQYRLKDALIPTALVEYDKYALGLAYDFNLSNLSTASKAKGGFEFCLRYNWSPGYGKMLGASSNHTTYSE
jgi:type IX secretion system PorP/SprF family membrane protein